MFSAIIPGTPQQQGSKNRNRYGAMYDANANLPAWRRVAAHYLADHGPTMTGAVIVAAEFTFPRPLSHYGTGRNAGTLRKSAPAYPAVKPDADKLIRSTQDALTTVGAWRDDAQAVDLFVCKRYADSFNSQGCLVSLREIGVTA